MKRKDFCMPRSVEVDEATFSETHGTFIVQPLERGFGTTLGNALRRALLSSVKGAAIRSIRIDGVQHEFSTLPGVVEDVPEIVLNLKEVCLRLYSEEDKTIVVEKRGKGEWIARDLEVDAEVEVLNPDLHIAALEEDADIRAELRIGHGRGYIPAEENKEPDQPLGTIAIDSIFSPIRKVNYYTENTRVGQRTDYEKLTIETWTNGAIRPDEALASAAELLVDHLRLLYSPEEEPAMEEKEEVDHEAERITQLLRMSVEELELSVRSSNCLRAAGIKTLADLVQKTEQEMLKYRNFGRKSLSELTGILDNLGLFFGMDVAPYLEEGELSGGAEEDQVEEGEPVEAKKEEEMEAT